MKIYNYYINKNEEKIISAHKGCGVIYLSGCNMHCCFCSNYQASQNNIGVDIEPVKLSEILLSFQNQNCSHISIANIVFFIDDIIVAIKIARDKGLAIPLVYNANGYDDTKNLGKIFKAFDIYLVDFKFADNNLGLQLSGVDDYTDTFRRNIDFVSHHFDENIISEGQLKSGVILRHLILPNYIKNTFKIIDEIKQTNLFLYPLNLMKQYMPEYEAIKINDLYRCVDDYEFNLCLNYAKTKKIKLI